MDTSANPASGSPVALVTGAGVRVGRSIAIGLAEAGYDLVVHYRNSREGAREVAELARRRGRRAAIVGADLAHPSAPRRLADEVREWAGRLDLLVNSASSFHRAELMNVEVHEWDRVMAVNLRAPFLLVRETVDLLRAAEGSVVNILDLSALQPWTGHPVHSVAKAGLLHLTRVMARSLAPEVRVSAVAPGKVLLPAHYGEAEAERARRRVPLRRIGTPGDVVEAVRFLARADYVTGEVVVVDGGARWGVGEPVDDAGGG